MTLLIDTAPVIALANDRDPHFKSVLNVVSEEPGPLVMPAPISAEVDYMLSTRVGRAASRRFLGDLAAGVFQVECLEWGEYATIEELICGMRPWTSASPTFPLSCLRRASTRCGSSRSTTATFAPYVRCREAHSYSCPPTFSPALLAAWYHN